IPSHNASASIGRICSSGWCGSHGSVHRTTPMRTTAPTTMAAIVRSHNALDRTGAVSASASTIRMLAAFDQQMLRNEAGKDVCVTPVASRREVKIVREKQVGRRCVLPEHAGRVHKGNAVIRGKRLELPER